VDFSVLAAGCSLIGTLVTIGGIAYTSGKLTQQIVDTRARTEEHKITLKEHAEKLEEHGDKISRLQEWRAGFNAAVSRASVTRDEVQ